MQSARQGASETRRVQAFNWYQPIRTKNSNYFDVYILPYFAKNVASRNIVRTLPLRTARTTKHDHNINQATARTRSNIAFFFSRISQFCAKSLLFCLRHPRIMWPFSCPSSHGLWWALCWHSAVDGEGWCSCGTWGQGSLPEKWSQCFPYKVIDLLKKKMGVHTD